MPRVSVRIVSDLPPTVADAVVTLGVACAPALPPLLAAPHPAAASATITQMPTIAADPARFIRILPRLFLPNGSIADHLLLITTTSWVTQSSQREEGYSRGVPRHPA